MADENSRRSQPTIPYRLQRVLLAGAVALFVAGSVGLSCALGDARQALEQETPQEATGAEAPAAGDEGATGTTATSTGAAVASGTDEAAGPSAPAGDAGEQQPGSLVAASELTENVPAEAGQETAASSAETDAETGSADSSQAAQPAQQGQSEETPTPAKKKAKKKTTRKRRSAHPSSASARTRAGTGDAGGGGSASSTPATTSTVTTTSGKKRHKTKVLHHAAYQKVPVYRTDHHVAARVDGATGEAALCPVCRRWHDQDFDQQVIDHYKHVYCKICGKKHASAYTETVRVK